MDSEDISWLLDGASSAELGYQIDGLNEIKDLFSFVNDDVQLFEAAQEICNDTKTSQVLFQPPLNNNVNLGAVNGSHMHNIHFESESTNTSQQQCLPQDNFNTNENISSQQQKIIKELIPKIQNDSSSAQLILQLLNLANLENQRKSESSQLTSAPQNSFIEQQQPQQHFAPCTNYENTFETQHGIGINGLTSCGPTTACQAPTQSQYSQQTLIIEPHHTFLLRNNNDCIPAQHMSLQKNAINSSLYAQSNVLSQQQQQHQLFTTNQPIQTHTMRPNIVVQPVQQQQQPLQQHQQHQLPIMPLQPQHIKTSHPQLIINGSFAGQQNQLEQTFVKIENYPNTNFVGINRDFLELPKEKAMIVQSRKKFAFHWTH
ncbi:hypothetical protein HELRODRAFT_173049 [Helobdella robusta]|uniref:Uncharacterized protein n=1 Tax=Helobdella robusta TaxID=6412 RepID=T1F6A7_HELRO|nr:hypothetical protein HELRODRAFT_173049 [Helobdella robusta]ESO03999.1 hypothetical protein HELRODRAFT_173049 [Helobdella robusta]